MFYAIKPEAAAVALEHVDLLSAEIGGVAHAVVAKDDIGLSVMTEKDEEQAIGHHGCPRIIDVDNLYGTLELHSVGHVDHDAVLTEHCVEPSDGIVVHEGSAAIHILLKHEYKPGRTIVPSLTDGGNGTYVKTVMIGRADGLRHGSHHVVDHIDRMGIHAGNTATIGLVGIRRKQTAMDVDAIFGSQSSFEIRILIQFPGMTAVSPYRIGHPTAICSQFGNAVEVKFRTI